MDEELKGDKIGRVLRIYAKLTEGCIINKVEEVQLYNVVYYIFVTLAWVCCM